MTALPPLDLSSARPVEQLTYEEALSELESIVAALESGDYALDVSMALYERGQALARYCSSLLEQAELKVRMLTDEGLVEFRSE
jgi:exodeoxyribonuclease VII small subunit